ncbi:MAG TPA: CGNR zinc finger domain-containing protein [Micromonosporaceae bacterium]|nr:CGNR zinc finger domain-containing protein [Micromonosporaceae bacterium]
MVSTVWPTCDFLRAIVNLTKAGDEKIEPRREMVRSSESAELIVGFTNTVDLESGRDELASPARLSCWLLDVGLVERRPDVTEADLRAFLDLRAGMREALSNDAPAASHRLALADAVLARSPILVSLTARDAAPNGRAPVVLVPAPDLTTVPSIQARLAIAWAELVLTGQLRRLKRCADQRCGEVFWDTTRNHSRRWCSMQVCGNRAKARRHTVRARQNRPDD